MCANAKLLSPRFKNECHLVWLVFVRECFIAHNVTSMVLASLLSDPFDT